MIKETFPYLSRELKFDKKKHKYLLENKELVSVTTWLNSFEPPFNPYQISEKVSKNPNSTYFGLKPKDIRSAWQKTSHRGPKKHKEIEDWLNEKKETCVECSFLETLGINSSTAWSEITLYSGELGLAGTADIITYDEPTKTYKIWDIKTIKNFGMDKLDKASMQLLIYCRLLHEKLQKDEWVEAGGVILIEPKGLIAEGVNHEFEESLLVDINYGVIDKLGNMLKKIKK